MSRERIQRQRAIINRLSKKPCKFEEIQDHLKLQEDITGYRLTCSLRTFQRDVKDIATLYEIEIEYDKSQLLYRIVHDGREELSERLMETFDLYNALNLGNSFGEHLLFENRRSLGTEHLHGLLHAIKNHFEVSFSYHKYYDDSVSCRTVQPTAIKEARQRWYLLGKDLGDGVYKSFGLDRINELEISRRHFEPLKEFNAQREYQYAFGVINSTGEKPQKIELLFTSRESRYIKSLPLHPSQEVLEDSEEGTRFGFFLIPTYDLQMEILSFGDQVKVIKPASLRKEVVKKMELALRQYR